MAGSKSQTFRFGDVEVREREFSLVKAGEVLPVEPKAFRVLLILLRNSEKLIPKEELLNAVWGDAAVTENSLTRSIALLRRLLGDETHNPRYIETVATVGYRWVCRVEVSEESSGILEARGEMPGNGEIAEATANPAAQVEEVSARQTQATQATDESPKKGWKRWLYGGGLVAVGLAAAVWYLHKPLPPPRISTYTQITHDGQEKSLAGTDGSRLYFTQISPRSIDQVGIAGGEIAQIPVALPEGTAFLLNVSPDGSNFLVDSTGSESPIAMVWNVRALGGSVRRLGRAWDAAFSPDGESVVFSTEGDISVMRSDGTGAHKLAAIGGRAYMLAWSPDGRRIRFSKDGPPWQIWEISSNGSDLHPLLAGWHTSSDKYSGGWTPDGKFYVFCSKTPGPDRSQIWALDERSGLLREPASEPVQLTTGPIDWTSPVPGKDGKNIYAQGSAPHGELVRFDSQTKQFQPFLGGISAEFVAFSKDGQFVAYVSYPEGILWKANRDGTGRTQLTESSIYPVNPRWSPDGKKILFGSFFGPPALAYIVSAEGGSPQRLLPESNEPQGDPNWSPDGRQILYGTGGPTDLKSVQLRILDLANRQVTTVPGSTGMWSQRWSPDGRHIAAISFTEPTLRVFDTETQQWSALSPKGSVDFPTWSRDSQSIYYLHLMNPGRGVFRVRLDGGEPERVAELKDDWHLTGAYTFSMSLDPADEPILLRDVGGHDIYALTLEVK